MAILWGDILENFDACNTLQSIETDLDILVSCT